MRSPGRQIVHVKEYTMDIGNLVVHMIVLFVHGIRSFLIHPGFNDIKHVIKLQYTGLFYRLPDLNFIVYPGAGELY